MRSQPLLLSLLALLALLAIVPTPAAGFFWPTASGAEEACDGGEDKGCASTTATLASVLMNSEYGKFIRTVEEIQRDLSSLTGRRKLEALRFTLPRIAMIGMESSGKSSTLERLAGFSFFPRARHLCTRVPIHRTLRPNKDEQTVTVTLPSIGGGTFGIGGTQKVTKTMDPEEVEAFIGTFMAAIQYKGLRTVRDRPIVVEFYGPDLPTLDLVDLPGMVEARTEEEVEEIRRLTEALHRKYLSGLGAEPDQITFAIVVVPATVDKLANVPALRLVQELGIEDRTIGAISKCDKYAPDNYHTDPYHYLRDRLMQTIDTMKYDAIKLRGYAGLVNRNTLKHPPTSCPQLRKQTHWSRRGSTRICRSCLPRSWV